jgi:hypothetical protein
MTSHAEQNYGSNLENTYRLDTTGRNAGFSDLFGSMLGFAGASTVFALRQMQNAVEVFVKPQGVMNRVRNSLDNISHAMNQADEAGGRPGRTAGAQHRPEPVSVASTTDQTAGQTAAADEELLTGRKR